MSNGFRELGVAMGAIGEPKREIFIPVTVPPERAPVVPTPTPAPAPVPEPTPLPDPEPAPLDPDREAPVPVGS